MKYCIVAEENVRSGLIMHKPSCPQREQCEGACNFQSSRIYQIDVLKNSYPPSFSKVTRLKRASPPSWFCRESSLATCISLLRHNTSLGSGALWRAYPIWRSCSADARLHLVVWADTAFFFPTPGLFRCSENVLTMSNRSLFGSFVPELRLLT